MILPLYISWFMEVVSSKTASPVHVFLCSSPDCVSSLVRFYALTYSEKIGIHSFIHLLNTYYKLANARGQGPGKFPTPQKAH